MRKLKVNTKLTIRKVNRLDNTDKFGLTFGLVFMLPAVTMLLIDIFRTNGAKMSYKMKETIQKLRDYANLKDDWYITRQLDILEKQIALEITKAELKQVTDLNNFIK